MNIKTNYMLYRKATYNTIATVSPSPSDLLAAGTGTIVGGFIEDTRVLFITRRHLNDTRQSVALSRQVLWWKHC